MQDDRTAQPNYREEQVSKNSSESEVLSCEYMVLAEIDLGQYERQCGKM